MLEVTQAVADAVGAARTGVRLSPISPMNDLTTSDPQAQFDHIVAALSAMGVAYIHVFEAKTGGDTGVAPFDYERLRKLFAGSYMANNEYDRARAEAALAAGHADLFAFGRPFIANPDLVERMRRRAPIAPIDPATLYGGGAKGYTDYPTAAETAAA